MRLFFLEIFLMFPKCPLSIFKYFAIEWMLKNPKGSPYYIFRHYGTYRKLQNKFEKIPNSSTVEEDTWHFEVLLLFLSLRYGGDLGRSRLVNAYLANNCKMIETKWSENPGSFPVNGFWIDLIRLLIWVLACSKRHLSTSCKMNSAKELWKTYFKSTPLLSSSDWKCEKKKGLKRCLKNQWGKQRKGNVVCFHWVLTRLDCTEANQPMKVILPQNCQSCTSALHTWKKKHLGNLKSRAIFKLVLWTSKK